MDTVNKEIIEKKVYEDDDRDYASKGVAGTGLGLGIAGTALGLWALARQGGGLFGGGAGMPENVNINTVSDAISGRSGAPTAFQAWEKGCNEALSLTNAIWGLHVSSMQSDYDHRQTDIAEKFQLWKSQVDADFGLYKTSRDLYDVLNERYANKFNELDKKVAVLEATRPYQDKLIQCEIDRAFTASVNYTDRRTCRMITGELVLPNTPTVTGYPSYSPCNCPASVAPTA